jgi:lipopolysaccharide transport system ATP-binding protein
MGKAGEEGRTVLFVSHNMASVRHLCRRAILLVKGEVKSEGRSDAVADGYLQMSPATRTPEELSRLIAQLPPDESIRLENVAVRQEGGETDQFSSGKPIEVLLNYRVLRETHGLRVFFILYDTERTPLFRSFAHADLDELPTMKPGRYSSCAVIPADLLAPKTYEMGISASIYNLRVCLPEIFVRFQVHDAGRMKFVYAQDGPGDLKLAPCIPWTTRTLDDANSH